MPFGEREEKIMGDHENEANPGLGAPSYPGGGGAPSAGSAVPSEIVLKKFEQ